MMNEICIYIPVTRVDFLDQTFMSVIKQTDKKFNLLVMDNSVEDSMIIKDLFQNYFGDNCNAKLIRTPRHLGDGDPTQSWNYGLNFIENNYFTLLGDDDVLAENYIWEVLKLISDNPGAPILRTKVNLINEINQITKYGQSLPKEISWDEYIYERGMYKLVQSTSEFCIKTKELINMGGYLSYPFAIKSDDASYVTLMLKGKMISTNATHVFWRRHGNNLSMRVSYNVRVSALKKYYDYIECLLKNNQHCLEDKLVLSVINVSTTKERLFVLKNKMYRNVMFRPIVKFLCDIHVLKSI